MNALCPTTIFSACLLLTVFAVGLLLGMRQSMPDDQSNPDWQFEDELMAKLSDLQNELEAVNAQLSKAIGEINGKIDELADALDNVDLPEEAETALAELKAKAQALDDIVPDAEPEEPEEPEEE